MSHPIEQTDYRFRFRDWQITISVPADDYEALRGTVGWVWPSSMLPEAIENGAQCDVQGRVG